MSCAQPASSLGRSPQPAAPPPALPLPLPPHAGSFAPHDGLSPAHEPILAPTQHAAAPAPPLASTAPAIERLAAPIAGSGGLAALSDVAEEGQFANADVEHGGGLAGNSGATADRVHKLSTRASSSNLSDALAVTTIADSPPLPPLPAPSPSPPLPAPTPSSATAQAALISPDDEVEALAETVGSDSRFPAERKNSLTPSEEGLLLPDLAAHGEQGRRPSTDGASVRSGRSGQSGRSHSYATAKSYFPLVSERKKRTDVAVAGDGTTDETSPAPSSAGTPLPVVTPGTDTPPPLQHARRRPSGTPSTASSTRASSVFPTITPSRSAGANVFPLRSQPGAPSRSVPSSHSDTASTRSGPTSALPSPPTSRLPASASSPNFTRPFSTAGSSYAPSIAPSNRSAGTTATSRHLPKPFIKPTYAASQAPSHAESYYASAAEPMEGPASIFLNPTAKQRSVKELLPSPKKKLSSLFGLGKSKASSSPGLGAVQEGSAGGTNRGKSALILDAALTTSAVWAAHRGEQSRMPAQTHAPPSATAFGAPPGYRPAHQVRRQQEEAAARLAASGGGAGAQAMMGGGGEEPVSQEAIAEAFARNQGRAGGAAQGGLARRSSLVSMASVADIATPASAGGGGAFPVRQQVFATRPRPLAGAAAASRLGGGATQTGLGIATASVQ